MVEQVNVLFGDFGPCGAWWTAISCVIICEVDNVLVEPMHFRRADGMFGAKKKPPPPGHEND